MATSRIAVAGLLLLLCSHTLSFVVQKRSTWNPNRDRGELNDALRLIEQQRLRLQNINDDERGDEESWWPPAAGDEDTYTEQEAPIDDLQYNPSADEYLQSPSPLEEAEADSDKEEEEEEDIIPTSDKRSHPVPADMHEIEDMLDTSDETKMRSEEKRETGLDLNLDGSEDPSAVKKENKVEQLDPDLVKKLLAEADKMEVEKVEDYAKAGAATTVSPEELQSVLGGTEEQPPQAKNERRKKADSEDQQGEVGAFQTLYGPGGPDIKRKRSGGQVPLTNHSPSSEEPIDLESVKKLILLEDMENTNLANALNLATLAQLERTDKYLPKEIDYLKQAISHESRLQTLLNRLDPGPTATEIPSNNEEDEVAEPDSDDTEPLLQRKRTDPKMEELTNLEMTPLEREKAAMLRYLLRNGVSLSDGDFTDPGPRNQWYTDVEGPNGIDFGGDADEDTEDSVGIKLDRKRADEMEGAEGAQNEVQGVLRAYLRDMPRSERRQLKNAVEQEIYSLEQNENEGDTCAAVAEMVDGCPLQADENVELDDEALDLCNRHSLCYKCGALHGMSADDCDRGYMNEANRKCEDEDEDCENGATALYLMFLRHHRYMPASAAEDACSDPCVLDYIVGAKRK